MEEKRVERVKRVMIIIWKWNDVKENERSTADEEDKIIKILDSQKEIKDLLEIKINENKESKLLILCHTGSTSSIQIIEDLKKKFNEIDIFDFSGEIGSFVYANDIDHPKNGLLDENGDFKVFEKTNYYVLEESHIKKDNFNSVWDHYMKPVKNGKSEEEITLKKKDIKKKIHKILQLWLPLAIDIQGLSEVFQKGERTKAIEYWGEIKGSTESFKNLWGEHNDIAKDLNELELHDSKEIELNNFLCDLDSQEEGQFPNKKYLNPNSALFFPIWLEKFARKLD